MRYALRVTRKMLKILFLGDINGKIGREAIKKLLPQLKRQLKPDLVVANAENAAHGTGVNVASLKELMEAGVDWFTSGDHAFDKEKQLNECLEHALPIIRPANFPPQISGHGYALISARGHRILLINLVGRVFMDKNYDCPFRKLNEILAQFDLANEKLSAIIIDMHAEATSEKAAFGHYADGKVSAVLGTHTHVMTADEKITEKGMAYISDAGMVGAADECIGVEKEEIIKMFLTQIKYPHVIPEKGLAVLNGVLVTINSKTAKATEIKRIIKYVEIK
ncbi:TIGR00282 family metallophosphoesterase [Candidatus Falkowbacteria bacterium]|nr:TIGR00282 family metallophosphoesterase [Candidatus Falkowbacteria bacterium]